MNMEERHVVAQFISLGAGVQSSVMLMMAEIGEITPRPDGAIFADTQWEPPTIYDHLEWMKHQTSIPIHTAMAQDLANNVSNLRNHSGTLHSIDIPAFTMSADGKKGMIKRQCTTNYKIKPIRRKVRELLGMGRFNGLPHRNDVVEQWLGISTDEAHRMRDSDVEFIRNRYPLVELGMSRKDCLSWWSERFPGKSLEKSSCMGCPYQSRNRWVDTKHRYPEHFDRLVKIDAALRGEDWRKNKDNVYLHPSMRPLDEAVAASEVKIERDGDGFGNECEGVCGV